MAWHYLFSVLVVVISGSVNAQTACESAIAGCQPQTQFINVTTGQLLLVDAATWTRGCQSYQEAISCANRITGCTDEELGPTQTLLVNVHEGVCEELTSADYNAHAICYTDNFLPAAICFGSALANSEDCSNLQGSLSCAETIWMRECEDMADWLAEMYTNVLSYLNPTCFCGDSFCTVPGDGDSDSTTMGDGSSNGGVVASSWTLMSLLAISLAVCLAVLSSSFS